MASSTRHSRGQAVRRRATAHARRLLFAALLAGFLTFVMVDRGISLLVATPFGVVSTGVVWGLIRLRERDPRRNGEAHLDL